jgi:hypothetical protein
MGNLIRRLLLTVVHTGTQFVVDCDERMITIGEVCLLQFLVPTSVGRD